MAVVGSATGSAGGTASGRRELDWYACAGQAQKLVFEWLVCCVGTAGQPVCCNAIDTYSTRVKPVQM